MASKQPNGQAMAMPSASPGFNFTYVVEGQAAPPPQLMGMPYGSGMMAPMAPHPTAHYPAYGMPPGGMPHPMMMQMPISAPAAPRTKRPSGPSEAEFPPLCGTAEKGTDVATEQKPTPKKEKKAHAPIVPSVVVSKARK
jgi:hypothetical protein